GVPQHPGQAPGDQRHEDEVHGAEVGPQILRHDEEPEGDHHGHDLGDRVGPSREPAGSRELADDEWVPTGSRVRVPDQLLLRGAHETGQPSPARAGASPATWNLEAAAAPVSLISEPTLVCRTLRLLIPQSTRA